MNAYEVGKQPCATFKPAIDGNASGTWSNVHECIYCAGGTDSTVSSCENCHKDHHANGYESCARVKAVSQPPAASTTGEDK